MKGAARIPRIALALACATVLVILGARIFGPSDLYQNLDQSKTISFTADMVLNGRWALPIDAIGEPSRKPPLYNWIGAPIFALGWHSELALKLPSVLAGLATIVLTFFIARRLLGRDHSALACAAAVIWIAAPENAKHVYFARPDMLLIALLTGGWLAALCALDAPSRQARRCTLIMMWLCTGLGVLAKGPAAALIPLYAALHAIFIGARTNEGDTAQRGIRPALHLGWWWGVPIVLVMAAAWLVPAYLTNPDYVREGLLGTEMAGRFDSSAGAQSLSERIAAHSRPIRYFFERFAPWSVLSIVALLMLGPIRRWREHALAPALLWMGMVLVIMTLLAGKGGAYIAPAYPAAAILAVYAFAQLLGAFKIAPARHGVIIITCALIVGSAISVREMFFSRGARTGTGDALIAFAHDAARAVGDDTVVFDDLGYLPIPTLMGRHQAGAADADTRASARWIIMPLDEDLPEPILATPELRRLRAQDGGQRGDAIRIGLWAR